MVKIALYVLMRKTEPYQGVMQFTVSATAPPLVPIRQHIYRINWKGDWFGFERIKGACDTATDRNFMEQQLKRVTQMWPDIESKSVTVPCSEWTSRSHGSISGLAHYLDCRSDEPILFSKHRYSVPIGEVRKKAGWDPSRVLGDG